ncbi:MAG: hypothetical protein A4S09_09560 [Proteobacteria bacterium SG_bin7]|nr:MAG: hypothetical protein A4S09_09560 [Proteobacteria bacterium SG_bin7]
MLNLAFVKLSRLILGVSVYLVYSYGLSQEITFGPEWEFTHKRMQLPIWGLNGQEAIAARSLAKRIENLCKNRICQVKEVDGKWEKDFRVTFSDGWHFTVSYDPWCVEIQAKPMTIKEMRRRAEVMNKFIFDAARAEELYVDIKDGAGHIDFGARSAFGNDGELFLRFFVDFANHPELPSGILRKKNLVNAPPIIYLPETERQGLEDIIRDFNFSNPPDIKTVAQLITKKVYSHQPYMPPDESAEESIHYQALGIKHLLEDAFPEKDRAMDIRAARSQRSVEEFILLAELIGERIAYLKKQQQLKAPMVFNNISTFDEAPEALVSCYYEYIRQMGGNWKKYKKILPLEWQRIQPRPHQQCPSSF